NVLTLMCAFIVQLIYSNQLESLSSGRPLYLNMSEPYLSNSRVDKFAPRIEIAFYAVLEHSLLYQDSLELTAVTCFLYLISRLSELIILIFPCHLKLVSYSLPIPFPF